MAKKRTYRVTVKRLLEEQYEVTAQDEADAEAIAIPSGRLLGAELLSMEVVSVEEDLTL